MENLMALALLCGVVATGCEKKDAAAFERMAADAIGPRSSADASVIRDQYVLVPELGVVLYRPQGDQWRVTKSVDRASERPIAKVEFDRSDHGGSFSVIISEGDLEDLERQAVAMRSALVRSCTAPPKTFTNAGFEAVELWLVCPVIPGETEKETGVPLVIKAVVTVRRKLPDRVIAVIGMWQPEHDGEMGDAMMDVVRKSERLIDL